MHKVKLRECVKRRHLGMVSRQSGQHQFRHGKIDKGLTAGVGALKIAGEPTMTREPGIGAFNHPSSGKHMKAFGNDLVPIDFDSLGSPHATNACPRMFDDLQVNAKVFFYPALKWAFIAAICPDQQEARQLSRQRAEQHLGPFTIRDIGRQHFDATQEALCVDQKGPFSAPDFFLPHRSLWHRHAQDWF
jgi:hypothetical protein